VHTEILEELNVNWNIADEGKYPCFKYSNVLVVSSNTCHAVYANLQGPKDKKCPFYHSSAIESESELKTVKKHGNIIQLECQVKFHFFLPVFTNEEPSTNSMVIISYGEHTHPPPPPRKVPSAVQERLLKAVMGFGLIDATARRLIHSPTLSIMLNGKSSFSHEHVSLINQDVVNYFIRKE